MAITLEGIALPDLVIPDEFAQTKVRSVFNETLGGSAVVWESPRVVKYIDLVGGSDFGFITRNVLITLRTMADVPGAMYELVYENVSYTVRFRNEDGGGIEASPVIARPNQVSADYYNNVRLKFVTWESPTIVMTTTTTT